MEKAGRRICIGIVIIILVATIFSCGNNSENSNIAFIVDDNGKKMYKNEDGVFVRNDWYEINGSKYYFDGNGYLLTDQWINDEYLVDESGKLVTNYWHEEKGKMYYLGPDGKYYRNDIYEIDGKEYLFDSDGSLLKDAIIVNKDKTIIFIDKRGVIEKNEGLHENSHGKYYVNKNGSVLINEWKTINGVDSHFGEYGAMVTKGFALVKGEKKSTESEVKKWCYISDETGNSKIVTGDWVFDDNKWYYADEDGVLLSNEWKTIDNEEYYFKDQCDMAVNEFVDGTYYVDENGKKVKNAEKNISGVKYSFDANGRANKKVTSRTENANWKLYTYTNTGNKYVTGKYYYSTTFLNSEKTTSYSVSKYIASFVADTRDIRLYFKYKSSYTDVTLYSDDVFITIKVNGNTLVSSQRIYKVDDEFLVLTQSQKNLLLNSLLTDNNQIHISIVDSWGGSIGMDYYSFEFSSTGFGEVYSSL
ncbi:MAG: hypothetical protein II411_05350 [Lachnospiraceae bacterium]|nr:hypothetical protein [Lachnospiraceae bacterium]